MNDKPSNSTTSARYHSASPKQCGHQTPQANSSWAKPPTHQSNSAGRYWQLAKAFGGVTLSICNSNWQSTLQQLANVSFGKQKQFFLSRPATSNSIVVSRNGKPVPKSQYTYDPKTNAISFGNAHIPDANDAIEVKYNAACKP